jgi:hypothetical protein
VLRIKTPSMVTVPLTDMPRLACPLKSHEISPVNTVWMLMKKVSRLRVKNTASLQGAAKRWVNKAAKMLNSLRVS